MSQSILKDVEILAAIACHVVNVRASFDKFNASYKGKDLTTEQIAALPEHAELIQELKNHVAEYEASIAKLLPATYPNGTLKNSSSKRFFQFKAFKLSSLEIEEWKFDACNQYFYMSYVQNLITHTLFTGHGERLCVITATRAYILDDDESTYSTWHISHV